jgi:hypothetical protein
MKSFTQFCKEAYDKEVMSGSQIRTLGPGGRIGRERKKTEPERRRMRTTMGPEGKPIRVPAESKPRKDIGTSRPTSTRVQQPTQERGSAAVKERAAAAAREERRKAAQARIAAKKSGESPSPSSTSTAAKPKDLSKQASQLLSKKAPEKKPEPSGKTDNMIRGIYLPKGEKRPYTRAERVGIERAAASLRKDILKGKQHPPEKYEKILKPGKLHASERR